MCDNLKNYRKNRRTLGQSLNTPLCFNFNIILNYEFSFSKIFSVRQTVTKGSYNNNPYDFLTKKRMDCTFVYVNDFCLSPVIIKDKGTRSLGRTGEERLRFGLDFRVGYEYNELCAN